MPLFYPPSPMAVGTVVGPDAWLLQRIFPGVPALWVALRIVALTVAAVLLSEASSAVLPSALQSDPGATSPPAIGTARAVGLGVAILQACAAPWASRLGPAGQTAYLIVLFVPALLLAAPTTLDVRWRPRWSWELSAGAAVIVVWTASRLVTDLNSPRAADVIDGWRGWIDILTLVAQKKNLLTNLFDPNLPGVGGALSWFHGVPLFQADVLSLSFRSVQIFQIVWVAVCAAGVGVLARLSIGAGVAPVAVAVFLFAPYTRFVTIFPGPFLAGSLYLTAVALCALVACRRRSPAAIAALGATSGIAIAFPSIVPAVASIVALTIWHLRDSFRSLWLAWAAALASFLAAAVPAVPEVLIPSRLAGHLRWDGLISIIDGNLLGQLALRSAPPAWANVHPRPFDAVVAAVLAPFAHPRLAIRLWGDALFDPLGGALIAIGLVACARSALTSTVARVLLLVFVAVLCPAFVSPVDIVDIVHAVALPVPAALLAAVGFAIVRGQLRWNEVRAAIVAAAVVCFGGSILFDAVNPRILSASSFGIMFRVLRPEVVDRAVVLAYGEGFVRPTKTLFTGAITAFGGPRPVGYLEYDGGELPASGFAAEGKDLLFWSHGFDQDVDVKRAVCAQWPDATLYEIWDDAGLGRVHAARVGGVAWEPDGADGRWRGGPCASPSPRSG